MKKTKQDKATHERDPQKEAAPAREQAAAEEAIQEVPEAIEAPEKNVEELLAQAERQRDEYLDMAQRVQAEFDNFRRRNQYVRQEAYEDGARAFIKTILPVVDNLERASSVESTDSALKEGVQKVLKQLLDVLEKRGVSVIDRKGERFDPNLEDAVVQGDPSEGEPGTVCEVLQKGYKLGDFVLRHAMVKVIAE